MLEVTLREDELRYDVECRWIFGFFFFFSGYGFGEPDGGRGAEA